jgi:hypothetical protein
MHAKNPPFLERNLDLGYLARELAVVRRHNMTFDQSDPQETLLMFAEGGLVLMAMERLLRTILGPEVGPNMTLPNLLQLAFSERLDVLDPPTGDAAYVTDLVTNLRNALLHANYEQAAQQAGCADVRDYFRNRYARDLETLYAILDNMMSQLDPATGRRRETPERRADARERLVRTFAARARKQQRTKS